MKSALNRKLAITGALGALSIFLGITRLGLIPWFSGAAITIMHVPVIIGTLIEGPVTGGIIGVIFGVFSLIQATIAPTGALDPFFKNPLVSVLPRVLIAVCSYSVFFVLCRVPRLPKMLAAAIACFAGSLANTFFVLLALLLLKAVTWELLTVVFVANGLPEAAAAVIIGVPVTAAWLRFETRSKSRLNS